MSLSSDIVDGETYWCWCHGTVSRMCWF